MKIVGIIPARYASTRFPGKPLINLLGKSMIQRVYLQCKQASSLAQVIVATDDERIYQHVKEWGGTVCMTSPHHPSGTDRLLELAELMPDFDGYINIQGDEPCIAPEQIDQVTNLLKQHPSAIATLIKPIENASDISNSNVVKVVCATDGKALYFSRSPIPHLRNEPDISLWLNKFNYFKHIGIYGFPKSVIPKIRHLEMGKLETAESLEQLRWLENGLTIYTAQTTLETQAIDSPEDVEKVIQNILSAHSGALSN